MIFKIYTDTSIFVTPDNPFFNYNTKTSICFYAKKYKLLFCKPSKSEEYIKKLNNKGFNFTIEGTNSNNFWGMHQISCDDETTLLCALLADEYGIVTVILK